MSRRTKGNFHQTLAPLLFLTPNMLIFGVFIILPAVVGLRLALYEWSILGGGEFVGLANFRRLIGDEMFWITTRNTLIYVLSVVPLLLVSSLGLGALTAKRLRAVAVFRSFYYLPAMLSFVIVAIVWRWILGDELGIVNYMLRQVGMQPVSWLTAPGMARGSVIFATVWMRTGFFMVMFVAGLQAIPDEFYDAAAIDGASPRQTFFRVTLPLLKPTVLVVTVLSTIEAFKAFEIIYVLTGGGPGYATKLMVHNIYELAFEQDRMGYAASNSIVLLIIIGVLTFSQFAVSRGEFTNE